MIDGDTVVSTVEEVLRGTGGTGGKVSTSISTGGTGGTGGKVSISTGPSATATDGGDAYGAETGTYDSYDGYGNYETYYDESTAAPDGDSSRRVTITSIGTGGDLDLGAGAKIDLGAGTGTGVESRVVTGGGGSSMTVISNKTTVG